MEINKQLFEDVLLGKLKGTFVLRDGSKYDTFNLGRNTNKRTFHNYPYTLYKGNHAFICYTTNGKNGLRTVEEYKSDIINFIPDTDMKDFTPETNMKENELTIEIPDGKIVDWEESKKQNKIVLKDQLTYEDICRKLFDGDFVYYINTRGRIITSTNIDNSIITDPNNAASAHQLECILAKNKLATVAKYLNDGWTPKSGDIVTGLELEGKNRNITFSTYYWATDKYYFPQFAFKSQKLAQRAIEILGEETVKLALEPLGI